MVKRAARVAVVAAAPHFRRLMSRSWLAVASNSTSDTNVVEHLLKERPTRKASEPVGALETRRRPVPLRLHNVHTYKRSPERK